MIERSDSQQTSCSASAVINGERVQVATASCTIRPGRGMNMSIDLSMGVQPGEEVLREVGELFAGYLRGEFAKAAGLGVPLGGLGAEDGAG